MKLSDKFVVAADREKVFRFVTDPDSFVKLIPDVQKYEKIDERNFKVAFKIGLGMIKGTLSMSFKMEEVRGSEFVKVVGHGSGMQSTADLVLNINLNQVDGGTEVAWDADVVVGGMVASVGSRLIESTTKTKVKEIVEGLKRELEPAKK
ncbi:MAG: carbon monoxide dehydrogenase subunit G, partial [Candidatus Caldarchaeum sp.]|nr:carbon monoxide dehydrogenase subunit G [Candidatus Caldarchaeum sp.]